VTGRAGATRATGTGGRSSPGPTRGTIVVADVALERAASARTLIYGRGPVEYTVRSNGYNPVSRGEFPGLTAPRSTAL
jgi:hypothetical protein